MLNWPVSTLTIAVHPSTPSNFDLTSVNAAMIFAGAAGSYEVMVAPGPSSNAADYYPVLEKGTSQAMTIEFTAKQAIVLQEEILSAGALWLKGTATSLTINVSGPRQKV